MQPTCDEWVVIDAMRHPVHPILDKAYYITIPALIGTVIFAGLAVIGQYFLSRQAQQVSESDGRAVSTD